MFSKESADSYKTIVKKYLSEILCALEELHSLNVVHRDVKPDNIMVDDRGHIKLIDFGFAKVLESKH